MHGLIFSELQRYADARLGAGGWDKLRTKAGLPTGHYLITQRYPDEEAVALVSAASALTGLAADAILQDFGEFLVPTLVSVYKVYIRPEWRTLDLLEFTESNMHKAVRLGDKMAEPPRLKVSRTSPQQVEIRYGSSRKMCGVAKGIITGIAKHYVERVTLRETSCMLRGAPECVLVVQKG